MAFTTKIKGVKHEQLIRFNLTHSSIRFILTKVDKEKDAYSYIPENKVHYEKA